MKIHEYKKFASYNLKRIRLFVSVQISFSSSELLLVLVFSSNSLLLLLVRLLHNELLLSLHFFFLLMLSLSFLLSLLLPSNQFIENFWIIVVNIFVHTCLKSFHQLLLNLLLNIGCN